jgi:hypothetical protein
MKAFYTDNDGNLRSNPAYFYGDELGSTSRNRDLHIAINVQGRAAVTHDTASELEVEDAGRQRFARAPQSNHLPGGGWNDESNPADYLPPQQADPRNQTLRPNARPAEYRGTAITPPDYTGRYSYMPSANTETGAGKSGVPVVSGPRTDRADIGLSGTPAYNAKNNLSTVSRDPGVMYSTSANGGLGALKNDGMGSRASTSDVIKAINKKNSQFWQGAAPAGERPEEEDDPENETPAGEIPDRDPEEEQQPSITRHTRENPDGSKIVMQHEVHKPPPPYARTVDIMRPRFPLPLPRLNSEGGRQGAAVAKRIGAGISTMAEYNRRNAEFWQRHS